MGEEQSGEIVALSGLLVIASIPVATGIAILRYRLYDIDRIINRTLVYGVLTGTLLLVYFGGVAASEAIFRALTGQEQQPQIAVVVSTLVIAALFTPLRRRIQRLIDRRFYRRKYDARKTLEAFSAKLRYETDLEALNNELVGVVRDNAASARLALAAPRPTTEGKRRARVGPLAQRLVHPVGGVPPHRGHPMAVVVEGQLDTGVPGEVLNVPEMDALAERNLLFRFFTGLRR